MRAITQGLRKVTVGRGNSISSYLDSLPVIGPLLNWTQRRNYPQGVKRFYAEALVQPVPEGPSHDEVNSTTFGVNLDTRKLRTPGRAVFRVQSQLLAHLVAIEWGNQGKLIVPSFMHLTGLANTVQDNPLKRSREDLTSQILALLPHDTLLFRASEASEPKLVELQTQKWDPILRGFESQFGVSLPAIEPNSILTPEIPPEVDRALEEYLGELSYEALQGLLFASEGVRSLLLALAVVGQGLGMEEAVGLSGLETSFQADHWGNVEWAHDLEFHETLSRLSAGALFFFIHTKTPFVSAS